MRVLQLCKKFPYPLKDGESIAVTNLSKALNELGCEVTLLSMNTTKHYCEIEQLPKDFNHYSAIHHVVVDNKVELWSAFLNIFSKESYHITRFISQEFENKLVEILQSNTFDVIQLETPVLSHYIPVIRRYSKALVVLRSHNVEHEIWGRIAENKRFFALRWYFKRAAEKLKSFEKQYLNEYDLVLAITKRDLQSLKEMGLKRPGLVIPIGMEINDYQLIKPQRTKNLSLFFIGSLDWMPNQEGLKWFLENVWKKVKNKYPQLTFNIAGRNTPDWVRQLKIEGVVVHGEVESSANFIDAHSMMVVPLFSGSGMRVKILEGMAMGKPVITTRLGLEGIEAHNGTEILTAETANDFISQIEFLIAQPERILSIGAKGQEFVIQNFDNLRIAEKLVNSYARLIFSKPLVIEQVA